jgi:spore coat protein JB
MSNDKTREEMIMKIKEYNFSVIELSLYLDTHPDDEKALCLHREYSKRLKELKDKYQKIYGPLSIYFPCNKWRWLEEPWPWERGNF